MLGQSFMLLYTMCQGQYRHVMNIKWDYSYYQPWSDNKWLVDEMMAMRDKMLMQDEDITMQ